MSDEHSYSSPCIGSNIFSGAPGFCRRSDLSWELVTRRIREEGAARDGIVTAAKDLQFILVDIYQSLVGLGRAVRLYPVLIFEHKSNREAEYLLAGGDDAADASFPNHGSAPLDLDGDAVEISAS